MGFIETSTDFKNLFINILEETSSERSEMFKGIEKIYYNRELNSYYFTYYEINDKIIEYKYCGINSDSDEEKIRWMIDNGGWNVYLPYPDFYHSYILDFLSEINDFKERNNKYPSEFTELNIQQISFIYRQEKPGKWLWLSINSKEFPDTNLIFNILTKSINKISIFDYNIIKKYLMDVHDQIVSQIESNNKNLTELNHQKKSNLDDKIELIVLIPGYQFLIYKKVILQNPEYSSYVINNLSKQMRCKETLINVVSEHFPELNIK